MFQPVEIVNVWKVVLLCPALHIDPIAGNWGHGLLSAQEVVARGSSPSSCSSLASPSCSPCSPTSSSSSSSPPPPSSPSSSSFFLVSFSARDSGSPQTWWSSRSKTRVSSDKSYIISHHPSYLANASMKSWCEISIYDHSNAFLIEKYSFHNTWNTAGSTKQYLPN